MLYLGISECAYGDRQTQLWVLVFSHVQTHLGYKKCFFKGCAVQYELFNYDIRLHFVIE